MFVVMIEALFALALMLGIGFIAIYGISWMLYYIFGANASVSKTDPKAGASTDHSIDPSSGPSKEEELNGSELKMDEKSHKTFSPSPFTADPVQVLTPTSAQFESLNQPEQHLEPLDEVMVQWQKKQAEVPEPKELDSQALKSLIEPKAAEAIKPKRRILVDDSFVAVESRHAKDDTENTASQKGSFRPPASENE